MPQSLAKVIVHIVYSTKNRQRWLKDPELRSKLYAYNAAILKRDVDSPAILIQGVEDHVHILCLLPGSHGHRPWVEHALSRFVKLSGDISPPPICALWTEP